MPLPAWYEEEPPPPDRDGSFYLGSFYELSTCRNFGQGGVGPIPWDRVVQYAERKNLDKEMTDVFSAVIRGLDNIYLKDMIEQRKEE